MHLLEALKLKIIINILVMQDLKIVMLMKFGIYMQLVIKRILIVLNFVFLLILLIMIQLKQH